MQWRELAERQHGVFTVEQFGRLGVPARDIRRLVAAGELTRVRRGVYLWLSPLSPPTWEREAWIALAGAGAGAFLYRTSAGRVWGMDGIGVAPIEVAVSGRHPRGRVVRLESATAHVQTLRGFPVTSVPRTLLDLGSALSEKDLLRSIEWSIRGGHASDTALRDLAAQASYVPGVVGLRRALDLRPVAATATESDLETVMILIALSAGLPQPVRQHEVLLDGKRYRLDAAWPPLRLAAEADGKSVHGPEALLGDLRRQNAIVIDSWTIVRFTSFDLFNNQAAVARVFARAWEIQCSRAGLRL